MTTDDAKNRLSPRLLLVLKTGLILSTIGWGISFVFTLLPWHQAVERLTALGATTIIYQPLLAYWLKMSSAVFGCIGLASLVCFRRTERMLETIRLLVPLHLIVGGVLVLAAIENDLDPTVQTSFPYDIAFCFVTAALIGVPLAIQARRTRAT